MEKKKKLPLLNCRKIVKNKYFPKSSEIWVPHIRAKIYIPGILIILHFSSYNSIFVKKLDVKKGVNPVVDETHKWNNKKKHLIFTARLKDIYSHKNNEIHMVGKVNFGIFKKIKNNYFSCYISFPKFDLFHLWVFWALERHIQEYVTRAQNTHKWNKSILGKEI